MDNYSVGNFLSTPWLVFLVFSLNNDHCNNSNDGRGMSECKARVRHVYNMSMSFPYSVSQHLLCVSFVQTINTWVH